MRRLCVLLTMSVSGALAFPLAAGAVDHIVLHISPTKLARSGPLKAWSLDGTIVDASFYPMTPPEELFGVTLRRRFLNGRAAEEHAFRAAPAHTLTFDGNTGLWEARLGNMLTVRMAIETTREPQAVPDAQACRGTFMRVPVLLRGTFTLPTRTKVFKTVRRTRLAATVTYNSGGPVSCGAGDTQTCTASTSFSASAGVGAQLLASADLGGWLSLAFADTRSSGVDGAIWYHVMLLTQFNPLGGVLPGLTLRVPAKLPIQGSGAFSATETSTAQRGACHTTTARGTFDGVFRTRFVGWGGRTFRSPASAMYSESR